MECDGRFELDPDIIMYIETYHQDYQKAIQQYKEVY